MSQLTDYYRGEAVDTEGRKLQQAWDMWNYWEQCHDFIQWVFPLPEPSDFNPNAPLLSKDDIKIFQSDPEIRKNLIHSTELLLKFFGIKLEIVDGDEFINGTIGITFDPGDKEWHCRKRIFGEFNHNHLRMTRLLMCLTICDFEDVAEEIFSFLDWADEVLHEGIPDSCWVHWDAALEGRSLPRPKVVNPTETAQAIKNDYWESAKADYDEVFNESVTYAQDLKEKWFDNWAKKLLQMSAPTKE